MVNLEQLWLGKNKITKLEVSVVHALTSPDLIHFQGLATLAKLRTLSLQSNRITKLENLEDLTNLEELYLSHNGVQRLEGLENNVCDSF